MKYALMVSALSIVCLGCNLGSSQAQLHQAQTQVPNQAQTQVPSPEISSHSSPKFVEVADAPPAHFRTEQTVGRSITPASLVAEVAQAPPYDPDGALASAALYSGEVGTIEGDSALSQFLFDNDGEWVRLDVYISEDNEHYGEDWLALCADATSGDDCTAVSISPAETNFEAIFLVEAEGGRRLEGYWKVQSHPGMHQGFLSMTLGPLP